MTPKTFMVFDDASELPELDKTIMNKFEGIKFGTVVPPDLPRIEELGKQMAKDIEVRIIESLKIPKVIQGLR